MPEYTDCAAPGCGKRPRPFSRFCRYHYEAIQRTRDLRGRVLTKGEIRVHRQLARDFLARNSEHPAVVAALEYMAELLQPKATAGFLRGELERLRQAGADPTSMLASLIAMYSWAEHVPPGRELPHRTFLLNLGRHVIGTVPAATRVSRTGRKEYLRIRPSHAEALGRHLSETVGVLGLLAARQIKADLEAPQTARGAIRKALESVPFNPKETEEGNDDDRQ